MIDPKFSQVIWALKARPTEEENFCDGQELLENTVCVRVTLPKGEKKNGNIKSSIKIWTVK